jgi:superfamily II DNA or RNA helicase
METRAKSTIPRPIGRYLSDIQYASNRRSTLIFCPTVETSRLLTERFRLARIDARYMPRDPPQSFREAIVDDFKEGRFNVLVNCKIFTEGADLPPVSGVGGMSRQYSSLIVEDRRSYPGQSDKKPEYSQSDGK